MEVVTPASLVVGLHLACATLLVAGVVKMARPPVTPVSDGAWTGRRAAGVGVVEVVLGAMTLAFGGRLLAVVVTALYLAFAAYLVRLRSREAAPPCGCFGAVSVDPPTRVQIGLDLALAAASAVAAWAGPRDLLDVLRHQPLAGLPYLLLLGLGAALVFLADTGLGRLRAARRPARTHPQVPA